MNNNIEVTLLSKEEILSNSRVLQKVGKECNYHTGQEHCLTLIHMAWLMSTM